MFKPLLVSLLALIAPAWLAGTSFTYQGSLAASKGPATGWFDLRFSLYDAVANGNVIAKPLTLASVRASNLQGTITTSYNP
jgi:hypothetical protein